jgi:disulfide bond formation protein DsbB
MNKKDRIFNFERAANILGVLGLSTIVLLAFTIQLILHELPCPLCLLQRFGFLCMALGLLMNLRFGVKSKYYGLVLLSGLLTSFIGLRQIVLHIIPGTGEYGSAILGLHLYTWSYIISMATVIITAVILSVRQEPEESKYSHNQTVHWIINALFALVCFLVFANMASTFLMCGFSSCDHDPVRYELLQ